MCYNASYLEKKKEKLAERYKNTLPTNWNDQIKDFDLPTRYLASGFDHPEMVVITSNGISLMEWGLIPHWAKDKSGYN
jgi:putative SOS response-associated peptidase YedK